MPSLLPILMQLAGFANRHRPLQMTDAELPQLFPRLAGTGPSGLPTAPVLSNRAEAEQYLTNAGQRKALKEHTKELLRHYNKKKALPFSETGIEQIRCSLTLFSILCPGEIFEKALRVIFNDIPCTETQEYLHETNLERFVAAQEANQIFKEALRELAQGKKQSHWMWYIFPTPREFAHSEIAYLYGLSTIDEARQYLAHPVLGERLRTAAQALLPGNGHDINFIMGSTDARKLHSCMSLFDHLAPDDVFAAVLSAHYAGSRCSRTLEWIQLSR